MTDVSAAPRASSRFTREITAAILSPLTIWIIGWAPNPIFDLTIFIIGTLALYEFLVLGQRKGYSIPIVIFSGQVPTKVIGNDAFQEADVTGITRPCTKWNYLVKDVRELPRVVNGAERRP